jgi:UDP-glucose 4-epimerase
MRVFLTGASGYLGSLLAEHLTRMPEVSSITGISRTPPQAPLPSKLRFLPMDICSPDLRGAMAGHDAVIHTACIVLWPARMPATKRDEINLDGTRNVAQAALHAKVRRFIHASSMAAYDPRLARGKSDLGEDFPLGKGDSPFYYWNSKALAEKALTELLGSSATTLTLLRPIYIIGPHNRSTAKSYCENAVNLLRHDCRRQFIHEGDVAAAFIQALRTDMPGPFNIVPDDFIRMSEVWNIVGARNVRAVPLWLAVLVAWLRWRWLGSLIHPSWVRDALVDFTGSNQRLKSTGWKPLYGSADALRAAL